MDIVITIKNGEELVNSKSSKNEEVKGAHASMYARFFDDHTRYMGHGGMNERNELFDILCEGIKRVGDWDKVVILNGNYYENFIAIVNYVKEIIENGSN